MWRVSWAAVLTPSRRGAKRASAADGRSIEQKLAQYTPVRLTADLAD